MIIPKYARYDYCNQRACDFLEEFKITTFPVDVEEIIRRNKWGLVKYSELMGYFGCDRMKVIQCLGSEDGFTTWDGDNYTISYNDDSILGNRIRFTLMHEIGHVYLNHLIDFESTQIYRGSLTKAENKVLENEANAFARNVLVPTSMLQHLTNKNINNVAHRFGITPSAAQTRLELYNTDVQANNRSNVLNRLYSVFYNFYYKKQCFTCGYGTVAKSMHFCPICGQKTLQWGDEKMIYPKLDSYENGKLKQCPECENEETEIVGEYCQICGSSIVNHCTNDDCSEDLLPTNARYCPQCGFKSTFFSMGILKAWDYKEYDGFMNIPDEIVRSEPIDEDLPFN